MTEARPQGRWIRQLKAEWWLAVLIVTGALLLIVSVEFAAPAPG